MRWQKLILEISAENEETVSEILSEAGAVAVSLEDARTQDIFEPAPGTTPLWETITISGLFPEESNLVSILNSLQSYIGPEKAAAAKIESVPDQDWQQVCRDQFKPLLFANRLWIYPSWHEIPNDNIAHVLLDPGLAFGTGSHPTTALCLEWLAANIQPQQPVIDYGCGSGILAIAALKLGAKIVWAVDNDPQALEATRENAQRNQIAQKQLITLLPHELSAQPVDIVVANILANPLIELAPKLAKLVKPQGNIVLSGILENQIHLIKSAYEPYFEIMDITIQNEWTRIVGKKNIETTNAY